MLRGVIASLGEQQYTVTRSQAGSYVAGRHMPGSSATIWIRAAVQPASGRMLQSLPEGQRGNETVLVFTETPLKTRTPTTEPDRLSIAGEFWVCVRVEPWVGFGGAHSRAYFQREAQP